MRSETIEILNFERSFEPFNRPDFSNFTAKSNYDL